MALVILFQDERNQFQIYLKEVLLKNDVAEKVRILTFL